ncbi:hypothetical protein E9993_17770 [Labilibacter sediminis]|nr:hypothetical protein E9993_17770 [Labilibacter sediminis]
MTQIDKSIIQKVKDAIQVDSELESNELYDLLFDYRNTQHPDRYNDDELKKTAENKFKELNNLLDELARHIELEKQQRKPSELIPYQKQYEVTKFKQSVIWQEEELEKLKEKIESKDLRIEKLEEIIVNLRENKSEDLTKELIESYKPSGRSKVYSGLTFLLIFVYGILTKSEDILGILKKYSPLDIEVLNTIVFSTFIFMIILFAKKYIEEKLIKSISKSIISPRIINQFKSKLPEKEENKSQFFSESLVYDFIIEKYESKNFIVRFILKRLFPIYSEISLINLKDIFVYNLLNKQLIEIYNSKELDRWFRVKNRYFTF